MENVLKDELKSLTLSSGTGGAGQTGGTGQDGRVVVAVVVADVLLSLVGA